MLPQVLTPHLDIPKYIPDYSSHLLSRSKLASPPFFLDISHLVSASISPIHSHSPTDTVDDDIPSPHSPPDSSGNYYVYRGSGSFDPPISPSEMYEHYAPSSHSFKSAPPPEDRYSVTNSAAVTNKPDTVNTYLSGSPSPVDVHPTFVPMLQQPHAVPASYRPRDDRFNALSDPPRLDDVTEYSSGDDSQNTLLDHRRMSEPAILSGTNTYASHPDDIDHSNRLQPFNFNPPALNPPRSSGSAYAPPLHRGATIGSLRDVRDSRYELSFSTRRLSWKEDDSHRQGSPHREDDFDTPISPLHPNFTGSLESPTSGLQFSPGAENYYGPSPPNTGTSTSSAPVMSSVHRPGSHISHDVEKSPRDPNSKTYSFVALPGNAVKKRPRRRYDEIERLYHCAWPDCNKAYGTLNHLNAHVTMQKHGPKRSPNGMPNFFFAQSRFLPCTLFCFSGALCHRLICNILRIQRATETMAESQKGS
jgi:transcription factor CON7